MHTRRLGPFEVSAIGLGCMNLSHAYAAPPPEAEGVRLIHRALDIGVTHFDTAALYGFGRNETLVGAALKPHRARITLASKCGMTGVDGKRVIDGRPETIRRTCDESLARLQTDVIDLYYLHRWDKAVPIEESVGALADLVHAGKVRAIGLSEVSAHTFRKAHAVHPVAAVQSEYSLWTRNPEIALHEACRQAGATLVAFSPVARGWLAGDIDPATFTERDIRRGMPRFAPENLAANAPLRTALRAIAAENGLTGAQCALAWLLAKGEDVTPIPGTTSIAHLEENCAAADRTLAPEGMRALDALFAPGVVHGARYPAATQAEIDTEDFS